MKIIPPQKLWQWDINKKVYISGITDADEWQVHFATDDDCTALVLPIKHGDSGYWAYIPNQLVSEGRPLLCYLYNQVEDWAHTETMIKIPVQRRPKPAGYTLVLTDIETRGSLREDIGNLSSLTTQTQDNLVDAINEVNSKKHNDLDGRDAADVHPMSSITGLEQKLQSIDSAGTSQAKDIAQLKQDIETIEATDKSQSQALSSMRQSISSIQSASESNAAAISDMQVSISSINDVDYIQSQAIADAQSDIMSLIDQDTVLSQAINSLSSSVDSAFAEVEAALGGKQPVGNYITNAVDNLVNYYRKSETYTQSEVKDLIGSLTHINIKIVSSIDDVTEPNVIYLVPVSGGEADDYYNEYILVNGNPERIGNTRVDLSEYYTKAQTNDLLNKKQPIGSYVTSVNGNAPDEDGNVSIDVQTYTAGDGIDISESGEIAVTNPMDDEQVSETTTWSSLNVIKQLSQPISESGSIITCYPVDGSPLHVVSDITAVQEGEGDPSPDSVRPISGWDSASLTRCGKNLLGTSNEIIISNTNGTNLGSTINSILVKSKFFPLHNNYTISGTITAQNVSMSKDVLHYFSTQYTLPDDITTHNQAFVYCNERGDRPDTVIINPPSSIATRVPYLTITIGNPTNTAGAGNVANVTVSNLQLELGSTATSYEPYRGQTYTATFPETVYGGTLDWTTGILTKTHEYIASYQGESVGDEWISSTGLLSTGAEVLYRLDEPEVIQLSPQQILAISGLNTVYCDTGDVTVTGYEDPRHTIAKLTSRIAALESAASGI